MSYWLSWFIDVVPWAFIPSVVIAFLVRAWALDFWLVIAVFGYTLWFSPWARGIRRTDQEIWRGETHSFRETEERIFRSYTTTRPLDRAFILLVLSWMTFFALGVLQNLS